MKRILGALFIISFCFLSTFITITNAAETTAIDQGTLQAEIDSLLIPLKPKADYSIVKICGPYNNICAVAIDPPYREFPNILIFNYDAQTNRYIRVIEGLCFGIQDEPSGKLDLHTIGMGIDTIPGNSSLNFESDTVKKIVALSKQTGMIAIPYQDFIHLQGPNNTERSYIIDKTHFYDLAVKLMGDVYQKYPRQECTMYDTPDLTDLQLSYQNGTYLITGVTDNQQKWEVSFTGIDPDNNFLLQKKLNAQKIKREPANEYEGLLEKAEAESKKNPQNALVILNKAKELNPKSPQAYILTGEVYYEMGEAKRAGNEYQEALELSSKREKKKYINIIDATTTTYKSETENNLVKEGYDAIEAGKPKDALKSLNKALKLNPNNVRIYYEIGFAYVEINDILKAVAYFEKGRSIHPAYYYILDQLKYIYLKQSNVISLKTIIDDILKYYGDNPELYEQLGVAYYQNNMIDLAIESLETNIEKFPDYYISYYSLGQIYFLNKNYVRAKELLSVFVERATPDDLGNNSDLFDEYREKAQAIIDQCNAGEAK